MPEYRIIEDDPTGAPVIALLSFHLEELNLL
jgi:hypothetical protein